VILPQQFLLAFQERNQSNASPKQILSRQTKLKIYP
jgi:hypothetical protein